AEQAGRAVNAAYVFDYPTGLKLFAHRAFYVAGGTGKAATASLEAFAWKDEAEAFASKHGGKGFSLAGAQEPRAAREMGTPPRARAHTARTAAASPVALAAWRRPALRALSIGLFLVAWHLATQWDLAFYVRFQNIPSPGDVLAEAIELFGRRAFYVHILASLERIWLGFAIATTLGVGLGLLIGWFALVEDILMPPIELLRPIPAVAW